MATFAGGRLLGRGLVLFLIVGEIPFFDVPDVQLHRLLDRIKQLHVATEKTRLKSLGDAQLGVGDEYLPVGIRSRTDADGRNNEGFGDLFGQLGGNFFQDDGETTQFL